MLLPRRRPIRRLPFKLPLALWLLALLAAAYGAVPANASQRPVAAYSFDEGSGATAKDYAGGNDGTITGAWSAPGFDDT